MTIKTTRTNIFSRLPTNNSLYEVNMKDSTTGINTINNSELKILLVEDSVAEQGILSAILNKFSYSVTTASNGKEAMEKLRALTFDIVLSDWRMPIMDGFALCKKLHEDQEDAPYFILLTGQNSKCDLIAAMDAGADDFLTKPYHTEELRVRIQAGARIVSMQKMLKEKII